MLKTCPKIVQIGLQLIILRTYKKNYNKFANSIKPTELAKLVFIVMSAPQSENNMYTHAYIYIVNRVNTNRALMLKKTH